MRLLTSREAATVGGRFTSRWTCPGLPVEHRQFGPGVCAHVRRDRSMRSRWAEPRTRCRYLVAKQGGRAAGHAVPARTR